MARRHHQQPTSSSVAAAATTLYLSLLFFHRTASHHYSCVRHATGDSYSRIALSRPALPVLSRGGTLACLKRICFCGLGFSRCNVRNSDLLSDFSRIEEFLKDPWIIRVKEGAMIQVPGPKVVPPPPQVTVSAVSDGDAAATAEELFSARTKCVALQKKAAVASMAAEDFARRFESGALVEFVRRNDPYTKVEMDEVREQWARFFRPFMLN